MNKRAVLLLVAAFALASLMVLPVLAQSSSIPKPSVPEFTLKFVDKSCDVPTATTSYIDPYTNKTSSTTISGYYVKDFEIEIDINNQPFVSKVDNHSLNLFYCVRWSLLEENPGIPWSSLASWRFSQPSHNGLFPANSTSEYTALLAPANYPLNTKLAFQVEAILGYEYTYYSEGFLTSTPISTFIHESSGWSDTKTITVTNTSRVSSASPYTVSPILPLLNINLEQVAIIVLSILAAVQLVLSAVLLRRKREAKTRA